MSLITTVLALSLVMQAGSAQPDVSLFAGRWTSASSSGPTNFAIASRDGKVWITIDRMRQPLEATVYLPSKLRSREAEALVAHTPERMFIVRRHDDGLVLDMFSTFADRPPIYWSERFTRER
jgi:hypothetical protein